MMSWYSRGRRLACALALFFVMAAAGPVQAQKASPSLADLTAGVEEAKLAGHNAWMLTCTALVLFMTAPGLAMFYGGLVRKKNVLSVMMQCMFLMGLMTVLWALYGYSLAFGGDNAERWAASSTLTSATPTTSS